ncbi:MAG: hypothetical protein HYT87_07100 [Nitrospirae bacterium]|nr:hypothetical protein [Nitrospirota bacterium]
MLFLIEYDRKAGTLVKLVQYSDSERKKAQEERLQTELRLNREHIEHEVVILDAASEAAIRTTHRRYFEDIRQIASSLSNGGPKATARNAI